MVFCFRSGWLCFGRSLCFGSSSGCSGNGAFFGLGPEHAVGDELAHARAKARSQAVVQILQRFLCSSSQFIASGQQGRQRCRKGITCTMEAAIKQLKLAAANNGFGGGQHVVQMLLG